MFKQSSVYHTVMHQSIPAAPSPGGGAFANFCSARGPGICQPQSNSQAFDMHAFSYQSITTQRILLEKQAYWLNCQGQV